MEDDNWQMWIDTNKDGTFCVHIEINSFESYVIWYEEDFIRYTVLYITKTYKSWTTIMETDYNGKEIIDGGCYETPN